MDEPALQRIEKALRDLGSEHTSPPGWENHVLAATTRRRPHRWIALGAVVAAAAAVLLWWSGSDRPGPGGPLVVELSRGDRPEVVRGDSLRVGDTVRVTVRGGRHRAIWLYHRKKLMMACPGALSCADTAEAFTLTMTVDTVGEYTAVALSWDDAAPPAPKGTFDDDVAAAIGARATEKRETFTVQ
jgi:hypothetical protein